MWVFKSTKCIELDAGLGTLVNYPRVSWQGLGTSGKEDEKWEYFAGRYLTLHYLVLQRRGRKA